MSLRASLGPTRKVKVGWPLLKLWGSNRLKWKPAYSRYHLTSLWGSEKLGKIALDYSLVSFHQVQAETGFVITGMENILEV